MTDATPQSSAPPEVDACAAAGLVGAEHKILENFVGSWKAKVAFWMQPGADPMESEGTMVSEWILGGRFLEQRYASDFMGSALHGRGLFGYNNVEQCYEGLWCDTMSTAMMTEKGHYDAGARTFTMMGTVTEPGSGKVMQKRSVLSISGPDEHTLSMHFAEADSDEFWKCMEINYTRA